ncbi:MAG: peptide deformylase [Treponema sp.]|jgi:peptide deformylase|nr:peptide deformylase [Treponema sp.]
MEIITLGNEILRQKAAPIKPISAEKYQALAEAMTQALRQGKGVGLAGPQVGLLERIFVVHMDKDIPRVFINPSLLMTSQEEIKYEEGCLSMPGLWASLFRPAAVRIQAWNERGRPFTLDAEGMLARIILHEYDHLEGVLFIDRLPESKRNRLLAQFEKRKRA